MKTIKIRRKAFHGRRTDYHEPDGPSSKINYPPKPLQVKVKNKKEYMHPANEGDRNHSAEYDDSIERVDHFPASALDRYDWTGNFNKHKPGDHQTYPLPGDGYHLIDVRELGPNEVKDIGQYGGSVKPRIWHRAVKQKLKEFEMGLSQNPYGHFQTTLNNKQNTNRRR